MRNNKIMKKYRIIEIKEPYIIKVSEIGCLPYMRQIGYRVKYKIQELKEVKLFPWGKRKQWVDIGNYYEKIENAEFDIKFFQTESVRTIIKEY
jgi:hypothetical protein